ncbi:hypothetical protein O181_123659 [Austropuccinia psidii MF-1]|uniref:Uncharacterized protein n=1 Tax=Austropuccinia psidii MF-1 TaxID=1389203 RepID=A0A9Q3KQH1_9BASI|nr:hypothetical protein [Austropuccinia psidii MF-1]
MHLEQEIQVINPKDNNVIPEDRHKWRIPELPQITKDMSNFQQAAVEIYQSQYKNWFMEANQQGWEHLPRLWIGTMNPEKTQEILKGWTPMSCKGHVQKKKYWLPNQSIFSEDQKKELAETRTTALWKLSKPLKERIHLNKCQKKALLTEIQSSK